MEACEAVEKELQRVITKFSGVHEHSKRLLTDVTSNFEDLQSTLAEGRLHSEQNVIINLIVHVSWMARLEYK